MMLLATGTKIAVGLPIGVCVQVTGLDGGLAVTPVVAGEAVSNATAALPGMLTAIVLDATVVLVPMPP